MHSVLRLINLAMLVLAFVAAGRGGGDRDAAFEAGRWTGVAALSLAPLLSWLALRPHAARWLRKTAKVFCWLLVVFFGIGAIFAAATSHPPIPALFASVVIAVLCGANIWALRAITRREELDVAASERWRAGRHWRGELLLGEMFWLGGICLFLILFLQVSFVGMLSGVASLRISAALILGIFIIGALLITWHGIGVWRSATRRSREGASPWPNLAKLSVLAGLVAFAFLSARVLWLPLREHALIAMGKDPLAPIEARITTDDSVLLLHGTFGAGSAERVQRLLDESPKVKLVALSSAGGRLREASDIAQMVRERALNTYVDTRCESACTFVFLAGKDRAATPNARIGFHRPSFAGVPTLSFDPATDGMLTTYREAGIPGEFLDRVAATEPSNMWYPSQKELEAAGVINRISLGGETSAIGFLAINSKKDLEVAFRAVPMMSSMERHFPGTIDAAVHAAWMERTQGGIDSAVGNAARDVIGERYPMILAAASDAGLDEFAGIMVDQMKAASAISVKACELLLAGQLNIAQVLSPTLVQREHDWALGVLKADKLVARASVDTQEFQLVMAETTSALSPEVVEVIGEPDKFRDQPERQCAATIALYERIAKLPAVERHLLLRGMFQSGAL